MKAYIWVVYWAEQMVVKKVEKKVEWTVYLWAVD